MMIEVSVKGGKIIQSNTSVIAQIFIIKGGRWNNGISIVPWYINRTAFQT